MIGIKVWFTIDIMKLHLDYLECAIINFHSSTLLIFSNENYIDFENRLNCKKQITYNLKSEKTIENKSIPLDLII